METTAAPRPFAPRSLGIVSIAALGAALTLFACVAGPAAAKQRSFVGGDGKIHACYRVKGKPKGMVRVVRGGNHRCRRGERRMAWSVAAAPGAPGASGAGGQAGSGTPGASATGDSALEAQVNALTAKVAALEGLLQGVTNQDLAGMLATLNGVTNAQLHEAIDAVPLLETVCDQAAALTTQSNLLGTEFENLVTTLTGSLLGAIFGGISAPAALEPFSCPAP